MQNSSNFSVEDLIETKYGLSKILEIRQDGFIVLEPINWELSSNSKPKYYFDVNYLKENNRKNLEIVTSTYDTWILNCYKLKAEGGIKFKSSDYLGARTKYWESLDCLEKVGRDLSDIQKAEVLELTINLHNNLSLCCMKTKDLKDSFSHASNSIRLIEALEALDINSPLFLALLERKTIDSMDHLRKLWKRKALFYAGKANFLRKDYYDALELFKKAINIIESDPSFKKDLEDLKYHYEQANIQYAKINKKEKLMYKKALNSLADNQEGKADKNTKKDKSYESNKKTKTKSKILDSDEDSSGNWIFPSCLGVGFTLATIGFIYFMRSRKK